MAEQYVARLRPPAAFLAEAEPAAWLWAKLRELVAEVLACVLMPTHLHLLVRSGVLAPIRLERLLAAFGRRFDVPSPWLPLEAPTHYATTDKILRQVRYIHLNPCRPCKIGGASVVLVRDPLLWEWSTHRDLVGAIADPWLEPSRFDPIHRADAVWWHKYVSSDPHVNVSGTLFPKAEPPRARSAVPLERIMQAAAAATRSSIDDVERRGRTRGAFLDLAIDQGWTRYADLIDAAGCSAEAIRVRRKRPDEALLEASRLCLGDDRLLVRTSYQPPATTFALAAWQNPNV